MPGPEPDTVSSELQCDVRIASALSRTPSATITVA